MSLPVALRDAAFDELEHGRDWYEREQPGVGTRFEAAVWDRLRLVAEHPRRFPVVGRHVRCADVPGFPHYAIYYVAEPARILVLSVFHTSRDSSVWKRRR